MDLRGITLGADDITQRLNRKDEGCVDGKGNAAPKK